MSGYVRSQEFQEFTRFSGYNVIRIRIPPRLIDDQFAVNELLDKEAQRMKEAGEWK